MARVGVVLGIAVCGLVTTAVGQECPEYVESIVVNRWHSSPSRIEVFGAYAFLAFSDSVAITDISDFEGPRIVGQIKRGARDFDVYGDHFYYVVFERGGRGCKGPCPSANDLFITDISDPAHPVPILEGYSLGGGREVKRIAASGDILFVAGIDGLRAIDVIDPANPVEIGFVALEWEPSGLVVEGGLAYVAVPDAGLRIFDVSEPTTLVEIGFWQASWEAGDLEVSGGFAYVADGRDGLRVIDVINPAEPTEVGVLQTGGDALDVSVAGSVAVVGMAYSGVLLADVSDPEKPTWIRLVVTEGPALDVALEGTEAFVVTGPPDPSDVGEFQVLDLSVPDSPIERSSFEFRSQVMDVLISNTVLYAATGDSGLYVRDASNPHEVVEGFLDTPGFARGVTLQDGLALVADDHKGLRIVDVSDPTDLVEVGFIDTPGQARRVAFAGGYAYVADGDGGLRIIDISMPGAPAEVSAVEDLDTVVDVVVEGAHAYVVTGGYLRVIDVSNPANPVELETTERVWARSAAIKGQVLYVLTNRLCVYDLSNPSEPREVSQSGKVYDVPTDITISGDRAYVSTRDGEDRGADAGIEIFDINDPYFASKIGTWTFDGDTLAVAVSNGEIYLATGQPEIVILDSKCLTTYWVGIVTHNSGFHGSEWRSDVLIGHEAERSVGIDFILHTVDGEFAARASVDAGQQGVFEDIVGLLGYEGKGALEIRTTHPITVTSRIYSKAETGTHGGFLQGHRVTDCPGSGKLYGLREVEGKFRTNISVTNTTDETREVWIALYRTDGFMMIRYSIDVGPGMVVQEVRPYEYRRGRSNIDWGFATIDGGEGILASATVIDSRTNDAVIVPLMR
jgi:hypothetical protein